jgi:hypothetical protein
VVILNLTMGIRWTPADRTSADGRNVPHQRRAGPHSVCVAGSFGDGERNQGAGYFVKFDKIWRFWDFSGAAQRNVYLAKRTA